MWLSAHRRLGKLSSLKPGKAAPESVSRPLSCSKCFTSQTPDLQARSKGLNYGVRAVCLPVLFEEAGCGSMSERARFHTVVTWSRSPCTPNGLQVRCFVLPPCFRNPKAGSKASSVRRKETAIWWIFKQLLGCTTLELPERKMQILPPRSRIQLDTQRVSLKDSGMFQTDLGTLALPCRGN